jgi:membrane fusion protein (multidrug efflux system)
MLMKNKLKNWLTISLLIVPLILSLYSCSNKKAGGNGFQLPPTPVEVAKVKAINMADKFEAVGTIEAIEGVKVVSEIDASVVSLPFDEGSYIKQGELIAKLDDSQLSAEVNRAEALYTQSQAAYIRVKSIVDQNAGAPQDLDDALANLQVAKANYELAKARLEKTKIVAPFSGFVGARKVSVGTFLRTGQEITQLANLSEIQVSFSVPERYLASLKRRAEVIVSSTTFPGYNLKGEIISIEPMLDSETRNVNVVARVKNPENKFRPGMSANLIVILKEIPNALTVPNEAIFAQGNQSFVYVVNNDSTVAATPVTLGLQTADISEVVNGLKDGMVVIKAGQQKLFSGAKVMPVNEQN